MPLVKHNVMKLEVFILGKQIIDQKRKKGWGRGRRERIEKGSRERIEIERKEENKEHRHLPLLVVQLPQGTEFPTRFCSKVLQQGTLKVLVSSSRLGKGSGLKKLVKY